MFWLRKTLVLSGTLNDMVLRKMVVHKEGQADLVAKRRVTRNTLRLGNTGFRDKILLRIQEQAHVHELVGEQSAILVVEHGPELRQSCLHIDLVVDGREMASR